MITRSICPSMRFKLEGVVVKHADPEQIVRVRRLPIDANLLMRGNTLFTPFRLVINLKVDDPAQPGPVYHLNTAMELQVEYTLADLKTADEKKKPLRLGYWNGKDWIPFAPDELRLVPNPEPGTGGVGIVEIADWDDPTKAWGT
jgi:hypothetical protein